MKTVGRGEHYRVDRGVGQQFFVAVRERKAVLVGEALGLFRSARRAGDETDRVALALHACDEVLAPSAEADDCRADHRSFSAAAPDHGDITSLIPKCSPLRRSFSTALAQAKFVGYTRNSAEWMGNFSPSASCTSCGSRGSTPTRSP